MLIWSPLSLERVVEIADRIARDRPRAAASWVDEMFACVQRLKRFPHGARRVPESSRNNLREVIHGDYRVIYRVEIDRLTVLTVRHVRQDLRADDPDLV